MKKKRITYGISGMMEYLAVINVGRSVMKVPFTDGSITAHGVNPAVYTTDNLMVQHAIENSDQFKRGLIYTVNVIDLKDDVKIERNRKRIEDSAACAGEAEEVAASEDIAEAEEIAESLPAEEIEEPPLTPLEFDNNDDAKDFLVNNFGVVRSKLRLRADIISVGKANGIDIMFS